MARSLFSLDRMLSTNQRLENVTPNATSVTPVNQSRAHAFTRPRFLGIGLHGWTLWLLFLIFATACWVGVTDLMEGKFAEGLLMAKVSFAASFALVPVLPFIGWQVRGKIRLRYVLRAGWPVTVSGLLWLGTDFIINNIV